MGSRGTRLVGRQAEIRLFRAALRRLARGVGAVISVTGEGGIGKTRLLERFVEICRSSQVPVVSARAHEGEAAPPLALWSLGPREASATDRVGATVARLVTAALERPHVVVLDNLQWADSDSIAVAQRLIDRMPEVAVLLVISYRVDEVIRRPLLATLVSRAGGLAHHLRLHLPPLDDADCRRMIRAAGPCLDNDQVDSIVVRSEGVPLLLVELLDSVPLSAEDRANAVPVCVIAAVARRMGSLTPPERDFVERASILGVSFDLTILSDASGMERSDAEGYARSAMDAGLFRASADPLSYRFVHSLYRDCVLADVSPGHARAIHREVTRVLRARDPVQSAAAIISHAAAAVPLIPVDEVCVLAHQLVESAHAGCRHGTVVDVTETTIAVLRREARVSPPAPRAEANLAEMLRRRAEALGALADSGGATRALHEAFEIYARLGLVEQLVQVALTWVPRAQMPGTQSLLTMHSPDSELVRKARELVDPGSVHDAWLRLAAADCDKAAREQILDFAVEHRVPSLAMQVLALRINAGFLVDEPEQSEADERRLLELAATTNNEQALFAGVYWSRARDTTFGRLVDGERRRRRVLQGSPTGRAVLSRLWVPVAEWMLGEWDEAIRCCELGLSTSRGHSDTYPTGRYHVLLALMYAERGLDAQSDEHLSELRKLSGTPDARVAAVLARRAAMTGDPTGVDEASAIVAATRLQPQLVYWLDDYCRCVDLESTIIRRASRSARELLDRSQFSLSSYRAPTCSLWSAYLQHAQILEIAGLATEADARYQQAIEYLDRARYVPQYAEACYRYAAFLAAGPGRREQAIPLLRDAYRSALVFGSVRLRASIEALSEALRAGQADAARPGTNGSCPLTPRELEVAICVSQGYTNRAVGERLAISSHTVARHLQNIFDKTGMSNRIELTTHLIAHGHLEA
ncbi:MAG: LuxR family transcriptional regulator [Spirochaetaceae bacterium]|nr:MAG: LuxR family transcriptional regulator [Spirochaetaceae bacterium]